MAKILMILSGADTWTMKNGMRHPTGFWAEEFVAAHRVFAAARHEIGIATPQGRKPVVDPLSLALAYNNNDQSDVDGQLSYIADLQSVLNAPLVLGAVDPTDYAAVFVVGGHGPMQDLAVDPDIGGLFAAMLADPSKIVSAVCHGPASFISAFKDDGSWLFAGRKLTGFSNDEETQATFGGNAPWLLQDRLTLAGGQYAALAPWTPHVVVDGNLITGQQQVSAKITAEHVIEHLVSASAH